MDNNSYIRYAAAECRKNFTPEAMFTLIRVLRKRIEEEGTVLTPMVDINGVMAEKFRQGFEIGETFTLDKELRLGIDTMTDKEGKLYFPLFTSEEELDKGEAARIRMQVPIRMILENGFYSDRAEGVVIDPFGDPLILPKPLLKVVLE